MPRRVYTRKELEEFLYRYDKEDLQNVEEVLLKRQWLSSSGKDCLTRLFEREFARVFGVTYAVAMNSASSVLHAAVISAGVGPGDEVIVDPLLRFGAAAVMCNNGIPIFADIDRETFLIDPKSIQERVTSRTKAIICTHLFGLPCEMDQIMDIAKKHGLLVIEDSAVCFFAKYKGRFAGTIGDIGVFSFGPGKPMMLGDGGMGITNNEKLRNIMMRTRIHGFDYLLGETEAMGRGGWLYRMTELQAGVGLSQLRKMGKFTCMSIQMGEMIKDVIQECDWLVPGRVPPYCEHSYSQFPFLFMGDRYGIKLKDFRKQMGKENIADFVDWNWAGANGKQVYLQSLIREGMYNKGCPLKCPLYKGKVRYNKGLCPNAEYVYPRLLIIYVNPYKLDMILKAFRRVIKYFNNLYVKTTRLKKHAER